MRFLGGYGVYVGVSCDWVMSSILDALQRGEGSAVQLLVGPYMAAAHASGAKLFRVGEVANSIREVVRQLRDEGASIDAWAQQPGLWQDRLPAAGILTPIGVYRGYGSTRPTSLEQGLGHRAGRIRGVDWV